jgi:hypothetical protein
MATSGTSTAVRDHFRLAHRQQLRTRLARHAGDHAARIANRAGPRNLQRGQHHVGELVLVLGRHQHDIGNIPQVADVEEAVVRGAVVAGEPGAVHAEDHRQLLQADVVDDGVEGALQEGRIDGADRLESLRGHAGREDDRVLLGDAHVEVALGMVRAEEIERRAVGHGRGDGDDLVVVVGQLHQRVGEDFGVGDLPAGLVSPVSGLYGPRP